MLKQCFASLGILLAVVLTLPACATRKYARNRINERVAPLEQRTGELEETSRRNSQDIGRLNDSVQDVKARADRAQSQADSALTQANQANTRIASAEESVNEFRENLDRFNILNTVTVNFKFDRYDLTPEDKSALDALAGQLSGRNDYVLEIEGFADYVGSQAYNDQLTQKRASTVQRYLAEQHGIDLYRMHILGFGQSRPVADNHTRSGRAQNRRVEVRVLVRKIPNASQAETSGSHGGA